MCLHALPGAEARVAEVRVPWQVVAVLRMAGSQPQQALPPREARGCDLAPVRLRGGSTALGSCRTLLFFPALLAACWACLGHGPGHGPTPVCTFFLQGIFLDTFLPFSRASPSKEETRQGFTSFASSEVPWSFVRCPQVLTSCWHCQQMSPVMELREPRPVYHGFSKGP